MRYLGILFLLPFIAAAGEGVNYFFPAIPMLLATGIGAILFFILPIGIVLCIVGAHYGWGFPWWASIGAMFVPVLVFMLLTTSLAACAAFAAKIFNGKPKL